MPEAVGVIPGEPQRRAGEAPALVVDLDGTLVQTDLLLESVLALLKLNLWYLFLLPTWLWAGRARLKYEVAQRVSLEPEKLPYQEELLTYLRAQRNEGRTLVLATGAAERLAEQVAAHLNLFDQIFASDQVTNLSGEAKRARLVQEFGERGYDYAGNSRKDYSVWASARRAIIVNRGNVMNSRVAALAPVERVLDSPRAGFWDFVRPLRPQHWVKNLLVFVPLAAAHRMADGALLGRTAAAFAAFACIASAGYLLNDLFDLKADRLHPRKRNRSFASGTLPVWYALVMIPALLGAGCYVALRISPVLLAATAAYLCLTAGYSLFFKKFAIVDVMVLAVLYTLRLIGGAAAIAIWPSPWILSLGAFLFFSLALVKRYSELVANHVNARGYEVSDQELLATMGIGSGYVATFVLVLYLTTTPGRSPVLWLLCPLLMYWVSYLWLSAHRGRMPDDPVVFIATDWSSRVVLLAMLAIAAAGL